MKLNKEEQIAVLRLFKAYVGRASNTVDEDMTKEGIVIPKTAPQYVKDGARQLYKISHEELNATLHKDYTTVAEADIGQLVIQQLIHYITTYGFASIGLTPDGYIPNEQLDIVEVLKTYTTIKPITEAELKDKLETLTSSGIALSQQTINDVSLFIEKIDVDKINNRELMILWYEKNDKVPDNPEAFLRYVIYKLTGSTLKIKSYDLIKRIKEADIDEVDKYLSLYVQQCNYGVQKLASVWYRNKPLFLAMKNEKTKSLINKIRKLAYKYHKPVKQDILTMLTSQEFTLKDSHEFEKRLREVTIYKLFALYNVLQFKQVDTEYNIFRIRNGKVFVKEQSNDNAAKDIDVKQEYIINEINNRIAFSGKKFYIPEGIIYGLPTSEKAYSDNLPEGSHIILNDKAEGLLVGIHWKNKDNRQTDLDLHAVDEDGKRYSWNSRFRSGDHEVLFSGDITDAPEPRGASEWFYIGKNYGLSMNLSVTDFRGIGDVPCEIIIARPDHEVGEYRNYTVNPNEILYKGSAVINNTQVIGSLILEDNKIKWIMSNQQIDNGRGGVKVEYANAMREVSQKKNECVLTLNDLIKKCNGAIVTEIDEEVVDLSLDTVSKETFIELLSE
ncbi:MAG: hypothetical protein Q4E88_02810 [Coriobacteriia bacterium]|nr:hypothetical protein [Coriobacteriia bacterium]